jgi:hypothetical protein
MDGGKLILFCDFRNAQFGMMQIFLSPANTEIIDIMIRRKSGRFFKNLKKISQTYKQAIVIHFKRV